MQTCTHLSFILPLLLFSLFLHLDNSITPNQSSQQGGRGITEVEKRNLLHDPQQPFNGNVLKKEEALEGNQGAVGSWKYTVPQLYKNMVAAAI